MVVRPDFGVMWLFGFTSFYHEKALPILVTTQFIPQMIMLRKLRNDLKATSISTWTLGMQMMLFAFLGTSWLHRLGKIGTGYTGDWNINGPYNYYVWVGWRWLNYVLFAIGQMILLLIYIYYRWSSRGLPGTKLDGGFGDATEQTSLLRRRNAGLLG